MSHAPGGRRGGHRGRILTRDSNWPRAGKWEFETGDMVGLDVTYGALMAMYQETGDPRWYPPLLLRRKVKAGHLGRKTGQGWYDYRTP
ncbi:MAG: 3-hydroxyacyl-CoA dehydrogenase family protein [Desulfobacterales bacterium]